MGVVCDNASNNDTMITELATLLPHFPGAPNRSRCFAHVLNLTAKSIIRRFDLPKNLAMAAVTESEKELAQLAENLEVEELLSRQSGDEDESDEDEDDNVEGWEYEDVMTDEEREEWDEAAESVRFMLVKVGRPCYS